jgi:nucleoside-diphosphate-sugar epimerase
MRILVTGNAGYIGSVMCPMLAENGFEVTGLDTGYFDGCDFGNYTPPFRQIVKDIRDIEVTDFDAIDAVVHLAGLSNDPLGELTPSATEEINFRASVRCAELAKQAGVRRFLFASSCSVYGQAAEDEAISEEGRLEPLTAYARSKVNSERGIAALADDAFSPVFLRNATVYGTSPRLRLDLVLNNLMATGFVLRRILVMSDGTPWRPLIHIEDFCGAFMAALRAPRELVHRQIFNVGQDRENYQVHDLVQVVQRLLPDCTVEYTGQHGKDTRTYRVAFGKIARVLRDYFRPVWTMREGALELLNAYRERGLTAALFHGDTYVRLRRLAFLKQQGRLDDQFFWLPHLHPSTVPHDFP